ncbi:MAG: ABC transporter ATP-binding protein [Peptoniphilus harei]|uniref:Putative bacitracin ABC transporter, ATP-binding protein BcrA n=1 Tax=Peptoniphilus harei ACS-146-V-Sch2b TaxID=908338 RepID=E4KYP2_9FIRM|nr:ABC transporter ATP-binding protein [Peptoniphilus harei]EFR33025.1 putative bacitracin ABC transporter, ATP-binding protein BcrA [Peptoniphilus harei ACS-146-V-Sch2b]MDK7755596.1 ABC transporter ATP-binding protein [Peptoniphilus harei]MDK7761053.1 ABC transporter ATP-binding protein [Peptoniphilus harei]MDK8270843.1 ABC transporter ATP-binding protein [Peptoniphilus harei]MDK8339421.1 ABC transporter ATP-binding protein [Peptoniphilus harei]
MEALKIENLHKSFGKNTIINGLSMSIPENTIFGFLGKNGAGKTTTMKMILGFLKKDEGSIEVFGEEVSFGQSKTNRFIGYLPDVPEFYGYMTAKEYLNLCGAITGLSKNEIKNKSEELLELVGLRDVNKRISGYSRGMKQRLGIAQALLNSPKLLICDEPTSALDPLGRKEILDTILKIKDFTTVIFSTHILSDVEAICDHVVVLDKGKNVLEGSIDELKNIKRKNTIKIRFKSDKELKAFKSIDKFSNLLTNEKVDTLYLTDEDNQLKDIDILNELYKLNIFPLEIKIEEPTLENIFMEVTKA